MDGWVGCKLELVEYVEYSVIIATYPMMLLVYNTNNNNYGQNTSVYLACVITVMFVCLSAIISMQDRGGCMCERERPSILHCLYYGVLCMRNLDKYLYKAYESLCTHIRVRVSVFINS